MWMIRVSCFVTERSRVWRCLGRPFVDWISESVRSKSVSSNSSLSSSLASRSVWLIRKKAAANETIAVVVGSAGGSKVVVTS